VSEKDHKSADFVFIEKGELIFAEVKKTVSRKEYVAYIARKQLLETHAHLDQLQRSIKKADELLASTRSAKAENPNPPAFAETLFSLLAPKNLCDAQLGDLREMFETDKTSGGIGRARRLYWTRVARSLGPLLYRRVKQAGIIGILIDYGRTKLGL
jgi:hypothetical protein